MNFGGKLYDKNKEYSLCMPETSKDMSNKETPEESNYMEIPNEVMFTQMSAKSGFNNFIELVVAAMVKEFRQLDEGVVPGKPVVQAVDLRSLTHEEKKRALPAVNVIKEKDME